MKTQSTYSPWLIASLATIAMAALMIYLDLRFPNGGAIWRNWFTENNTLVYFCEPASIKELFRHKVDTYTNLGFFFLGVLVFAYGKLDQKMNNPQTGFAVIHPSWSIWFGLALISTFVGSTFFHASLTWWGEIFDLIGVYAAALLPGFFNLHRIQSLKKQKRLPARAFLVAWALFWLLSSLLIFTVSSRVVMGGSMLLIGATGFYLFLQVKARRAWAFGASSLVLTFIAASFFVMDVKKVGCDPVSWYQAHGTWHLLAALASGMYYAFMRQLP